MSHKITKEIATAELIAIVLMVGVITWLIIKNHL